MSWKLLVAGAAIVLAPQARAENVDLVGRFAAKSREVASLNSIAVDRFAGRDGARVSMALERALMSGNGDSPPHFRVSTDGYAADGEITGVVSTDVREEEFDRRENRCVQRDANNKCAREEKTDVSCRRRIVELGVDVRVADNRRRAIAWTGGPERSAQIEWCEGNRPPESTDSMVGRLVGQVVEELRATFTPTTRRYSVRFRENTKGLPGDLAGRFKAVVKQSKRDLGGACAGWAELERSAPDHVGTVFNLGVCAEATGDFNTALARYSRSSELLGRGNEAEIDLQRIQQLIAARQDDARRGRR